MLYQTKLLSTGYHGNCAICTNTNSFQKIKSAKKSFFKTKLTVKFKYSKTMEHYFFSISYSLHSILLQRPQTSNYYQQ